MSMLCLQKNSYDLSVPFSHKSICGTICAPVVVSKEILDETSQTWNQKVPLKKFPVRVLSVYIVIFVDRIVN